MQKSTNTKASDALSSFGAQFANFILNSDDDFAKSIREQIRGEESQTSAMLVKAKVSSSLLGWIDNTQAMRLLGMSPRCLQSHRDNGTIPYSRIGNKFYYKIEDIQQMLEANKTGKSAASKHEKGGEL